MIHHDRRTQSERSDPRAEQRHPGGNIGARSGPHLHARRGKRNRPTGAIVRDRLAREREKANPQTDEREQEISAREKAVSDRENLLACKEYISQHKYPESLLKLYNTENIEDFKTNVEKLIREFPYIAEGYTGVRVQTQSDEPFQIVSTGGSHGHGLEPDSDLARAFARKG